METERARARYELGNALFLAAGRPDSAATWYRRVLEEDGEQPVARRAIYGLAEAYWEQGDTAAARQAYEQLVDRYPDSDLAVRARQRLNRQAERVGENQSVQADSGYVRAYRQWNQGAERPALEAFLDVARQYPDTEAAPRALLAAGIIYWRQLQAEPDSGLTSTVTRYLQAVQSDSTQARRRDSLAERRSSPDASADSVGANAPAPADEEEASMARLPAAPADTAVPDSARADTVRPDRPSARNSARVDSATADTTAAASTEGVLRPLGDLLRYLTERYSEAPQRKRADAILALIEGKAPPPDSVSVERIREQTGASEPEPDSSSNPDGPGGRPSAQEASSEADNSPQPTQSGGDDPLPAPTTVQSSGAPEAGWTVLVQAFAAPDAADEQRQILRNKLGGAWRPEVIQDPAADSEYLLVVGTFDTEEEAQVVQSQLQEKLNRRLDVRQRPGEAETP